ncbi:MAG: hypothetical protein A4E55_00364 [Pelotomaculum sp. PtaU1.Bin035]|nr:MAG: hypothetical protein A4E55_00364 [Pelotomaculum sp. PtaU1.Bin035]
MKQEIIELWKQVNRAGIDNLIAFLEISDFFTAPCSTQYHLAVPGGLAIHSMNVYKLLKHKVKIFNLNIPHETIIICGLGHDLCKIEYYKIDEEPASAKQIDYLKNLAGPLLFLNYKRQGITKAWASKLIEAHKNGGEIPDKENAYVVDDKFPFGHGEKSVSILQNYIQLTTSEKLAIRWHMVAFDAGIHFNYPSGYAFREAAGREPLVTLLFTADFEASQILEAEK